MASKAQRIAEEGKKDIDPKDDLDYVPTKQPPIKQTAKPKKRKQTKRGKPYWDSSGPAPNPKYANVQS